VVKILSQITFLSQYEKMAVGEFSPASPASNDEKSYNSIYLKSFVVKKEDFENLKLP
jgi:hypothetical protein